MAGGECRYDSAIPMNAIGFFGLPRPDGGQLCRERSIPKAAEGDSLKSSIMRTTGLLKGYILT